MNIKIEEQHLWIIIIVALFVLGFILWTYLDAVNGINNIAKLQCPENQFKILYNAS